MIDTRYKTLASLLVNYSTALKKGERVLLDMIDVPDEFFGWRGRGIGIFISLVASLAVIAAGLLRAGEEL